MSYATLDDLPNELLSQIVKELVDQPGRRRNLCSLRLVCKRIEPIARPYLFERLFIQLPFFSPNDPRCEEILETMAARSTNPYAFAEDLNIYLSHGDEPDKSAAEIENILERRLLPALATLTNLRSLMLDLTGPLKFPPNITIPILQCIASIPTLKKLTMYIQLMKTTIRGFDLMPLCNLTSIEITFYSWGSEESNWFPEIPKLISRCPGLEHLLVHLPSERLASPVYLSHLLPIEPSSMRLPLKELNLNWVIVIPEDFVHSIRHFQQLESLVMSGNPVDVYNGVSAALLAAGIFLKNVPSCINDGGFLDYVDSYSGAHRLQLEVNGDYSLPSDSPDILHRFFHSSIPKHRESLRELRLMILGETTRPRISWSDLLTRDQLEQLIHCKRLTKLYIEIRSNNIHLFQRRCPQIGFWLNFALRLPQLSLLHLVYVTWSIIGPNADGSLSFIKDIITNFRIRNSLQCEVLFTY